MGWVSLKPDLTHARNQSPNPREYGWQSAYYVLLNSCFRGASSPTEKSSSESNVSTWHFLLPDEVLKWNKIQNVSPKEQFLSLSHFFVLSSSRLIQLRQRRKNSLGCPLYRFPVAALNFFCTREINSFRMFLESCKQPEVRQCQIRTVRTMRNNFKLDVLYLRRHGSTSVVSDVSRLRFRRICLFTPTNANDSLFQPL